MKVIYSGTCALFKSIQQRLTILLPVGKILQDDKTVESYNIQEKDFLVCLPSKVRNGHSLCFTGPN